MIGLGSDKNQAKPKPTQTVSRPDDQLEAKPAKDCLWPGENDDEISMMKKIIMMMITWPGLFCGLG